MDETLARLHGKVGKRIPRRQDAGGEYGEPSLYGATETEGSKAQPTLLVFLPQAEVGISGEV